MTPEEKKAFEMMRGALEAMIDYYGSASAINEPLQIARQSLAEANAVQPRPKDCKDCGQSTKQDLIHTCSPQAGAA